MGNSISFPGYQGSSSYQLVPPKSKTGQDRMRPPLAALDYNTKQERPIIRLYSKALPALPDPHPDELRLTAVICTNRSTSPKHTGAVASAFSGIISRTSYVAVGQATLSAATTAHLDKCAKEDGLIIHNPTYWFARIQASKSFFRALLSQEPGPLCGALQRAGFKVSAARIILPHGLYIQDFSYKESTQALTAQTDQGLQFLGGVKDVIAALPVLPAIQTAAKACSSGDLTSPLAGIITDRVVEDPDSLKQLQDSSNLRGLPKDVISLCEGIVAGILINNNYIPIKQAAGYALSGTPGPSATPFPGPRPSAASGAGGSGATQSKSGIKIKFKVPAEMNSAPAGTNGMKSGGSRKRGRESHSMAGPSSMTAAQSEVSGDVVGDAEPASKKQRNFFSNDRLARTFEYSPTGVSIDNLQKELKYEPHYLALVKSEDVQGYDQSGVDWYKVGTNRYIRRKTTAARYIRQRYKEISAGGGNGASEGPTTKVVGGMANLGLHKEN